MQKAKLIVLDGGDNVGKATQTMLLLERLKSEGYNVGTLDFPQYTNNTFGKLIKECLTGQHGDFMSIDPKIVSVLYAADRFESKNRLLQLLEETDVVILDRYVSANMLHQGAKIADIEKRKEFLEWLESIEYGIFGLPEPDLTIALSVSPEHSSDILLRMVEEGKKTPDSAETDRIHQKGVAQCVEWLSSMKNNWTTVHCSSIEGLRSREDIHEEVYGIVKPLLLLTDAPLLYTEE